MKRKEIIVDSITKLFETGSGEPILALGETSFDVKSEEIVCLLGPSGCGKTTFLNLIAGFEHPTSGRVHVNATEVSAPGPDRVVVFQTPALFPWLTVLDNIVFGPRHRGILRAEYLERAKEIIQSIQLTGFEHRYPIVSA